MQHNTSQEHNQKTTQTDNTYEKKYCVHPVTIPVPYTLSILKFQNYKHLFLSNICELQGIYHCVKIITFLLPWAMFTKIIQYTLSVLQTLHIRFIADTSGLA